MSDELNNEDEIVDENTDIIPEETNEPEIINEQAIDGSENNTNQDTNDSISEENNVTNETSDVEETNKSEIVDGQTADESENNTDQDTNDSVSEEINESEIIDEQSASVDESENNMEQNDTVPEEISDTEEVIPEETSNTEIIDSLSIDDESKNNTDHDTVSEDQNRQEINSDTEPTTDMSIQTTESENNIPDFSDTETNNKPYYYMVGTFVNKEVSGTTTRCLVLSSIDPFDELKTVNNLKTYYEFNKIFAISATKKDIINSYRDTASDNAITESGKNNLLNNSITYIPETEISEITNLTDDLLVPSLTILVKTTSDEQTNGGEIIQPDTPVIDPEEETYKQYLRAGNIYILNDIIFIIPNNSDSIKKIVFVNGYYYLLTTNCLIYKLDENFKLVTTINLTKISSDISKTNIFSTGNMLIIQSDKTYVTDAESIKNNYGMLDTDVTIDSVKINTKTIVKILNK